MKIFRQQLTINFLETSSHQIGKFPWSQSDTLEMDYFIANCQKHAFHLVVFPLDENQLEEITFQQCGLCGFGFVSIIEDDSFMKTIKLSGSYRITRRDEVGLGEVMLG